MKSFLSILISLSLLAGSLGVNLLTSSCSCCISSIECECSSSSCESNSFAENEPLASCCNMDISYESEDKNSSCSLDCCTPEFYKLDMPLLLVYSSPKVDIPENDLPFQYVVKRNVLGSKVIAHKQIKIPDIPPPIPRSGLDLYSSFLC